MSAIGLVLSIAIPLTLLMVGAVLYNRSMQKKQAKQNQARAIRQRADDLLEALEYLILVDNHRDIQRAVLERISELYILADQQVSIGKGVTPVGPSFDPAPFIQRIDADGPCRKVLKSDRELKYGRRQFSSILKALSLMAKKKQISETAMLEYRRYLKMVLLEREVDTYTAQGDVAAGRGDVVTASNYYKAARKLLIEFDIQFPEKNARVKAIAAKTAALYRGEKKDESDASEDGAATDNLAKALSKEAASETNEFGMPTDPTATKKRY